MADVLKKMYIEITPRVLGVTGMDLMDKQFSGFMGKQKAQSKLLADIAEADSRRYAAAWEKAQERAQAANYRSSMLAMKYEEMKAKYGQDAALKYEMAWMEAQRKTDIAARQSYDLQRTLDDKLAAAQRAQQSASNVSRTAAIAGGANLLGNGLIGVGAVGAGVGYETIKQAMNWQTFVNQNRSNSPMTAAQQAAYQRIAFADATKYGANPQDVFLALRYGSEFGLQGQDPAYLNAALKLALPTGGTAALPDAMKALGTVFKNYPQMRNNPSAIANMIMAASQNAPGVNAPDFIASIPKLLNITGHINGPGQFAQALAMQAALISAGLPPDEAQTQLTNMTAKLFKPSPATWKYLAELKQATGIDLSGDFGPQALKNKGLVGVIDDLKAHNLGPATLGYLFPNMRGYFGALGLTGNQNSAFNTILGNVNGAPQANPIGQNFDRYLKLSSTQAKELQQQLHVLAITVGTELLPPFNDLLKNEIVPGVKDFSAFIEQNKGLVSELVQLSPWLITVGLGLKGIALAASGYETITKFGGALGGVGSAIDGLRAKQTIMKTTLSDIEGESATVIGTETTGLAAAGTGLLGIAGAIALIGAEIVALPYLGTILQKKLNPQGISPWTGKPAYDSIQAAAYQSEGWKMGKDGYFHKGNQRIDAQGNITTVGPTGSVGSGGTSPLQYSAVSVGGVTYPSPLGWGITRLSGYRDSIVQPYSPGIVAADSQGLAAYGGGPAVHDWNYFVKRGTPVKLPIPAKLLGVQYIDNKSGAEAGHGGYYVYFQAKNGGIFFAEHLDSVAIHEKGKWYPAGTVIGKSGQPTGFWGSGAQFSVTADAKATAALTGVPFSGGPGVTGLPTAGAANAFLNGQMPASTVSAINIATGGNGPASLVLGGIWKQESGGQSWNFGTGLGTNPVTQAKAANADYRAAYDWLATPAGRAAMKAHGLNPDNPHDRQDAALAIYNSGKGTHPGGFDWGVSFYSNAQGTVDSATYSPATPYARGMAYAAKVDGFINSLAPPSYAANSAASQVNYTPPTGGKPSKSNPQTPYEWSEWWSGKASTLSSKITQIGDIFTTEYGPNWGPHSLKASEWQATVKLLDSYYYDQYQSERSLINSEFARDPKTRNALLASAHAAYVNEVKHPFQYGPFAKNTAASSTTGRVSPVQVVGSNDQLAQAKEQVRLLKAVVKVLQEQLRESKVHHKTVKTHVSTGGRSGARTITPSGDGLHAYAPIPA